MHSTHLSRRARILLVGLCAVLAATWFGLGAPSASAASAATPHTWHVQVGAQSSNEAVQTMGYYPSHLWVDQGDTVVWTAKAAEIHTVTFLSTASPCPSDALCDLPAGFDPGDMLQSTPQGGSTYDGTSYYNSGIMSSATGDTGPLPPFVTVQKTYSLTLSSTLAPGTYTYYCLVHGMAMKSQLIVQAAGTPYPFTQSQYNRMSSQRAHADVRDGFRVWRAARHQADALTRQHGPTVLVGAMDDRAMVMRFIGPKQHVRVGDTVRFVATSMGEPHTVTFGSDVTGCGTPPCNPEMPWNVSLDASGNETASYPGLNGGFTGSPTDLNTGLMFGLPPAVTHLPSMLTVTFTHAGSYPYVCALHDYMGMMGKVVVHQDDEDSAS